MKSWRGDYYLACPPSPSERYPSASHSRYSVFAKSHFIFRDCQEWSFPVKSHLEMLGSLSVSGSLESHNLVTINTRTAVNTPFPCLVWVYHFITDG